MVDRGSRVSRDGIVLALELRKLGSFLAQDSFLAGKSNLLVEVTFFLNKLPLAVSE